MLNTDVWQARDIVADIQELQEKQAKDRRNSFGELANDPMEGYEDKALLEIVDDDHSEKRAKNILGNPTGHTGRGMRCGA
ncbi:hypothetical protein GCK32_015850 [Trichostrongylus colubriformis]|uniref:Uncharacterized protein n=1 Tax=Trichostrongylus colubriformis TaxID=6319 RepID=A0AAN8FH22_TRICO